MLRRILGMGVAVLLLSATSARAGDDASKIGVAAAVSPVLVLACGVIGSSGEGEEDDDEETGYARRGLFIGLAGTTGIQLSSAVVAGVNTGEIDDYAFGVNGRVGYRCFRYFSAEVQIDWLGRFEDDDGVYQSLTPLVITTNAKVHLLTGRFQPFLLAGLGVMSVDGKTVVDSRKDTPWIADFTMRFGAGLDFYLTEQFVLSVGGDYLFPTGELRDLDGVSVGWGLQVRF